MRENAGNSVTSDSALLQRHVPNLANIPTVPKQTHLVRRGNIFWFRMGIPKELRGAIGRREFMHSLRTSDLARAKRKVALESVRALAQIDAARKILKIETSKAGPVELTEDECWSLAVNWLIREEKRPISSPSERVEEAYLALWTFTHDEEQSVIRSETSKWLRANGFEKVSLQSYECLVDFLTRAMIEYEYRILNRYDVRSFQLDPCFADLHRETKPSIALGEVIRRYRQHHCANHRPRTRLRQAAHDRIICQVLGERTPIDNITRDDCRRYQEVIRRLPSNALKRGFDNPLTALDLALGHPQSMAVKTQNDHISALYGVFQYAGREWGVDPRVAEGLRVESDGVRARDRRLPFTEEHLRSIFDPRHYPSSDEPAKFWLPVLGAFTGARLGELVQLRVCNLHVIDGIAAISINAEAGKSIKTAHSARIVPIHARLIDLGFVEFAKKQGEDWLFAELWKARDAAGAASKWFARYLDSLGITDKKLTFHSFRHGAKSALENAGVAQHLIEALLGWAGSRGMLSVYGGPASITALGEAINKISYTELDLAKFH